MARYPLVLPRPITNPRKAEQGNKYIFNLILSGSFIVALLITVQLLYSFLILNNPYVLPRVGLSATIILYLFITGWVARHYLRVAVWMIIGAYLVVALCILLLWGLNSPIGILTLGFVIFLSSILLGARYILLTTCLVASGLVIIQLVATFNLFPPDTSSLGRDSTFGDLVSYLAVFCVFAITSWLSSFQNEQSLSRALRAEKALLHEKRLLSHRLTEQAESLKAAQVEEMHQLYKFAELGQLTSSLFHELANHLSVLHLDIQEFSSHTRNKTTRKINESIAQIDTMVSNIHKRITHENQHQQLNIPECISNSIAGVRDTQNTNRRHVEIRFKNLLPKEYYLINGDSTRLEQITTILLNNAVQASANGSPVDVQLTADTDKILLRVIDYGNGIPKEQRPKLFKPQSSSKKNGLGIGLYIAQQFAQTHFGGIIRFDVKHRGTCFTVELPRESKAINAVS